MPQQTDEVPAEAATRTAHGRGRRSQRDDLLRSAMELFALGGSRGTPLSAIAERIGVTTPAITHHFGTKQGLLLAIVAELDRRDLELQSVLGGSAAQRLDALGSWAHRLEEDGALANLARLRAVIAAEALDPAFAAHDHFVARRRAHQRLTADILEAARREGSIRADVDVERVAGEIVAYFQGAQFQWVLDPDQVDLSALIDGYIDRLRRDLAPARKRRRGAAGR